MKKVLTKTKGKIATASTLGHPTTIPHKFSFHIRILSITSLHNVSSDDQITVDYERRDQILATVPAFPLKFEKQNSNGTFDIIRSQSNPISIKFDVTLFKKSADSTEFLEKMAKLAVRKEHNILLDDQQSVATTNSTKSSKLKSALSLRKMNSSAASVASAGVTGPVTAEKIHLNLAAYAKVPDGKVNVNLKLSLGAVINCLIESTLHSVGKPGTLSKAGSVFSAITTGTGGLDKMSRASSQASVNDSIFDGLDDEDFDDLGEEEDQVLTANINNRQSVNSNAIPPPLEVESIKKSSNYAVNQQKAVKKQEKLEKKQEEKLNKKPSLLSSLPVIGKKKKDEDESDENLAENFNDPNDNSHMTGLGKLKEKAKHSSLVAIITRQPSQAKIKADEEAKARAEKREQAKREAEAMAQQREYVMTSSSTTSNSTVIRARASVIKNKEDTFSPRSADAERASSAKSAIALAAATMAAREEMERRSEAERKEKDRLAKIEREKRAAQEEAAAKAAQEAARVQAEAAARAADNEREKQRILKLEKDIHKLFDLNQEYMTTLKKYSADADRIREETRAIQKANTLRESTLQESPYFFPDMSDRDKEIVDSITKLENKNQALEANVLDLEDEVQIAQEDLEYAKVDVLDTVDDEDDFDAQLKRLHQRKQTAIEDIEELRRLLKREPEKGSLAEDLTSAKKALEIVNFQKRQTTDRLRALQHSSV